MNNLTATPIRANGNEYWFSFRTSAFMKLQKEYGISIMELMNASEDEEGSADFLSLFYLLKAGLERGQRESLSDEEIYDIQDDLEIEFGIEGAMQKVMEIATKSMESAKAKRQNDLYMKKNANNKGKGYSKKK